MTKDIDTAFLFSAFPPALQNSMQRVLTATEYHGYKGPHLKLSCGLLCLDLDDGEPAVAEIIGKGPGEAIMVRIRILGTTEWLTRTSGEAMLDEEGNLRWLKAK